MTLPANLQSDDLQLDALRELDTATLREELSRALTISAKGLTYLAAVWHELERRGEDLSGLRSGLAVYLPAIASGRLAPEAVVQFAGQRSLLRRIAALPVDEQMRLAHGEPIPVIVQSDDGEPIEQQVSAHALTAQQVNLVFDEHGRVRSPIEQRALYRAQPKRRSHRRRDLRTASIEDIRDAAEYHGYALAKKCSQSGCPRPVTALGLCTTHYQADRRSRDAGGEDEE